MKGATSSDLNKIFCYLNIRDLSKASFDISIESELETACCQTIDLSKESTCTS